jgi:hypothetical protein
MSVFVLHRVRADWQVVGSSLEGVWGGVRFSRDGTGVARARAGRGCSPAKEPAVRVWGTQDLRSRGGGR